MIMAIGTKTRRIREEIDKKKALKLKDTFKEPFISWKGKANRLNLNNEETLSYLIFTDEEKLKQLKGKDKETISKISYRDKRVYKKGVPTGGMTVTIKEDKAGEKIARLDSFFPFSRLSGDNPPPKELRARGVGAKLVNDLIIDLKKKGVGKVYVRSLKDAVGFYEKIGFKLIDKKRGILVKKIK